MSYDDDGASMFLYRYSLSRVNIIYKSSQPNKLPVPLTNYTQQKSESEVYKVNTLYIYMQLCPSRIADCVERIKERGIHHHHLDCEKTLVWCATSVFSSSRLLSLSQLAPRQSQQRQNNVDGWYISIFYDVNIQQEKTSPWW